MGKGVTVGCGDGVTDGVSVGGTGDGDGVSVGASVATGAGVADWQAVMKKRSPMISCLIAYIKTQLPGALFQASEVLDLGNLQLIAAGNTQKQSH